MFNDLQTFYGVYCQRLDADFQKYCVKFNVWESF